MHVQCTKEFKNYGILLNLTITVILGFLCNIYPYTLQWMNSINILEKRRKKLFKEYKYRVHVQFLMLVDSNIVLNFSC